MLFAAISLLVSVPHRTYAADHSCPVDILSCNDAIVSDNINPCCVPSPAGLFLFKQRFEADVEVEGGKWGIEGLDVLKSAAAHRPASVVADELVATEHLLQRHILPPTHMKR